MTSELKYYETTFQNESTCAKFCVVNVAMLSYKIDQILLNLT
jgi:hypothetical protein